MPIARFRSPAAWALTAALPALFFAATAPAGPLPAGVQGPAARAVVQGLPSGGPTMVPVGDPEKAARLGLPGLQAGDAVEVSHPDAETWVVRDPKSGRTVTTREAPDLGRK